jgi:hypothetical protein
MTFGKFEGETVQDILDNDPGYIVWLQENTDYDFHHTILDEAEAGPQHEFSGYTKRDRETYNRFKRLT